MASRKDQVFGNYKNGITGTCKDCEDRHPACHSSCEKYLKAKTDWDNKRETIREAKKDARLFTDYKVKKINKERSQGKTAGRRV